MRINNRSLPFLSLLRSQCNFHLFWPCVSSCMPKCGTRATMGITS